MWSPDPSLPLYDNDECLVETTQVDISFSYTPDEELTPPETFSVTSVVASRDGGVTLGSNSISGIYSASPHGSSNITYMFEDETYETVDNWDDVSPNAFEITWFVPPSTRYYTYTYTVTATGSLGTIVTASYTLITTMNWTAGMNALKAAVADTRVGRD